ncbi:MAG: DUF3253 domain-containing protein [Alphaproteobacteria bacterium]|nr:DUF3253 domain-containing protein [Alphaproteobacteria bacterium]
MTHGNVFSQRNVYPLAVVQDRYGGSYSRGAWIAIARADEADFGGKIIALLNADEGVEGPWSDDVSAMLFWKEPPEFVAVGPTPDLAMSALFEKGWWDDHNQAEREIESLLVETGGKAICPADVAKRINPANWKHHLGQVLAGVGRYGPNETECVTPDGRIVQLFSVTAIGVVPEGVSLAIDGQNVIVRIRRCATPRAKQ